MLTGNFCSGAADKHGQITWNNQSTKPNASKYVGINVRSKRIELFSMINLLLEVNYNEYPPV